MRCGKHDFQIRATMRNAEPPRPGYSTFGLLDGRYIQPWQF